MKKIILSTVAVLLLTGCQTPTVDEATLNDFPKFGYRAFHLFRGKDGNIPLKTESDIPNYYECDVIDMEIQDSNDDKLLTISIAKLENDNITKTKHLILKPDGSIYASDGNTKKKFKDIDSVYYYFFCADPRLTLNNYLYHTFSNLEPNMEDSLLKKLKSN